MSLWLLIAYVLAVVALTATITGASVPVALSVSVLFASIVWLTVGLARTGFRRPVA